MLISQILIPWNAPTGKVKLKKDMLVLKTKAPPQLKNTIFR